MYLIYTDLSYDDICAIEYLGHVYSGKTKRFCVVCCGLTHNNCNRPDYLQGIRDVANLLERLLPGCCVIDQCEWDSKRVQDKVTAIYCFSNPDVLVKDFSNVVRENTQVFYRTGELGFDNEYRYLETNLRKNKKIEFSSEALEVQYKLVKYDNVFSDFLNAYISSVEASGGIPVCYSLQIVLIICSKKCLSTFVFSNIDLMLNENWLFNNISSGMIDRLTEPVVDAKLKINTKLFVLRSLDVLEESNFMCQLSYCNKMKCRMYMYFTLMQGSLTVEECAEQAEHVLKSWGVSTEYRQELDWIIKHLRDFDDFGIKAHDIRLCQENVDKVVWVNSHGFNRKVNKDDVTEFYKYEKNQDSKLSKEEYVRLSHNIYRLPKKPTIVMYLILLNIKKAALMASTDTIGVTYSTAERNEKLSVLNEISYFIENSFDQEDSMLTKELKLF